MFTQKDKSTLYYTYFKIYVSVYYILHYFTLFSIIYFYPSDHIIGARVKSYYGVGITMLTLLIHVTLISYYGINKD